jgi:hypothetical protein
LKIREILEFFSKKSTATAPHRDDFVKSSTATAPHRDDFAKTRPPPHRYRRGGGAAMDISDAYFGCFPFST